MAGTNRKDMLDVTEVTEQGKSGKPVTEQCQSAAEDPWDTD